MFGRHRSRFVSLAALAVASVLAGPNLAEAQLKRQTIPTQRELNRVGLVRMWWSQATINSARDKVTHVTADEHNLYIQSSAGMTTCFDAETGQRLWAAQLGRRDGTSYPVTSNDEFALVCGGPIMYAVDKFTGESLWRVRLPTMPSAQPALDDERIYVPCLDDSIYALDLRKIRELFDQQLLPDWSYQTVAWRYQTGAEITTQPVPTGRVVNFASVDRSLYSLQVQPRRLIWQFETDAPISAPLVQNGRLLYLASRDFNFYCLDAENGAVRWEFVSGLPVDQSPRVIGDQVFLMPTRGGMFCLGATSGRSLWRQPSLTQFVAASSTTIYASDRVGNLVLVDRGDGSVIGSVPMRSFVNRYENDRSDRIYMVTQGGLVLAMRERGQEFPIFHKYPERQPLVPEFADPETDTDLAPGDDPADAPSLLDGLN